MGFHNIVEKHRISVSFKLIQNAWTKEAKA